MKIIVAVPMCIHSPLNSQDKDQFVILVMGAIIYKILSLIASRLVNVHQSRFLAIKCLL